MGEWLSVTWQELAMVCASGVVTYVAILLYTRTAGLRSFSKMSASDFAMTIAIGSLFASTISMSKPSLPVGLTALAVLFAGQWLLATLRQRSATVTKLIDNEPLLLMRGSTILQENLARANVTRADLYSKLREANVMNYDQVVAVVFETTGDVSVLHSEDGRTELEPDFLQDVIGSEQLFDREQTAALTTE